MARNFSSSLHKLQVTTAIVTAYPFTVAGWGNVRDAALGQVLWSVSVSTTANDQWRLMFRGDVAGDPIVAGAKNSAGTFSSATTTTGYSINVWAHACGVFAGATDRAAFINGGSKGTNTASNTPVPTDRTNIGIMDNTSTKFEFAGLIAEVQLWNVALTDAEVLMLANGLHPYAVRPGSLVGYWPVYGHASPEVDWSGAGNNMTVEGTAVTDHIYTTPPLRQAAGWRGAFPPAAVANPAYQPWYHRAPVLAQ